MLKVHYKIFCKFWSWSFQLLVIHSPETFCFLSSPTSESKIAVKTREWVWAMILFLVGPSKISHGQKDGVLSQRRDDTSDVGQRTNNACYQRQTLPIRHMVSLMTCACLSDDPDLHCLLHTPECHGRDIQQGSSSQQRITANCSATVVDYIRIHPIEKTSTMTSLLVASWRHSFVAQQSLSLLLLNVMVAFICMLLIYKLLYSKCSSSLLLSKTIHRSSCQWILTQ